MLLESATAFLLLSLIFSIILTWNYSKVVQQRRSYNISWLEWTNHDRTE